jgi:hypothetical protein
MIARKILWVTSGRIPNNSLRDHIQRARRHRPARSPISTNAASADATSSTPSRSKAPGSRSPFHQRDECKVATKAEPRILRVRADVHDAGGVVVSVSDTGAGISSQDVDQIFNPLFTTKVDGMGMGLWICRSIIEAHDGRLWGAQNVPRGAVFQFVLRS